MIKKILFAFIIFASAYSFAAFKENSQRYISEYDFQNRMGYFFDEVYKLPDSGSIISYCFSNGAAFGSNTPATGNPINSAPNSATINVIRNCAVLSIQGLSHSLSKGLLAENDGHTVLSRIFPTSILDNKTASIKLTSLLETPSLLSDDQLKETISYVVQEFLGTEENILSYGLITDLAKYNDYLFSKVNKSMSLTNIYLVIISELVLRDEFLTY